MKVELSEELKNKTFDDMLKDEVGTIYLDSIENGVRFLIMRGPGSLCVYIGVPVDHPISGFEYDDIPINVHGGLTFAKKGSAEDSFPDGQYWYGWDYSHYGDANLMGKDPKIIATIGKNNTFNDGKQWTIADVFEQIWEATYEFAKLKKLTEGVRKSKT